MVKALTPKMTMMNRMTGMKKRKKIRGLKSDEKIALVWILTQKISKTKV